MLQDHEQTVLMAIGAEGCYLLSVKRIAEMETGKEFNPVDVYSTGLARGWVRSDCLMLDAASVLGWLTDMQWNKTNLVLPQKPDPVGGHFRYIIGEYTKKVPSKVYTHFVLLNEALQIVYNPLVLDMTSWTLSELRVFEKVAA